MKWSEVAETPEYQSLTPYNQYRAQEDFFKGYIQTDPEFRPEFSDTVKSEVFGRKRATLIGAAARGIAIGTQQIPKMLADLSAWAGRNLQKAPVTTIFGPEVAEWDKNTRDIVGKKIVESSTRASDWWNKQMQTGWEVSDPELAFEHFTIENPSLAWRQAFHLIGQAAPSVGAAWLTGGMTSGALLARGVAPTVARHLGSLAGAAALGIPAGATMEEEAAKKGVPQWRANIVGFSSAVGNTVLEMWPLDFLLKGGTGRRLSSAMIGAMREGGEEVIQQVWDNVTKKIGYDNAQRWYEGTVESFIGGFGAGGLSGFVAPDIKRLNDEIRIAVGQKGLDLMQGQVGSVIAEAGPKIEEGIAAGLRKAAEAGPGTATGPTIGAPVPPGATLGPSATQPAPQPEGERPTPPVQPVTPEPPVQEPAPVQPQPQPPGVLQQPEAPKPEKPKAPKVPVPEILKLPLSKIKDPELIRQWAEAKLKGDGKAAVLESIYGWFPGNTDPAVDPNEVLSELAKYQEAVAAAKPKKAPKGKTVKPVEAPAPVAPEAPAPPETPMTPAEPPAVELPVEPPVVETPAPPETPAPEAPKPPVKKPPKKAKLPAPTRGRVALDETAVKETGKQWSELTKVSDMRKVLYKFIGKLKAWTDISLEDVTTISKEETGTKNWETNKQFAAESPLYTSDKVYLISDEYASKKIRENYWADWIKKQIKSLMKLQNLPFGKAETLAKELAEKEKRITTNFYAEAVPQLKELRVKLGETSPADFVEVRHSDESSPLVLVFKDSKGTQWGINSAYYKLIRSWFPNAEMRISLKEGVPCFIFYSATATKPATPESEIKAIVLPMKLYDGVEAMTMGGVMPDVSTVAPAIQPEFEIVGPGRTVVLTPGEIAVNMPDNIKALAPILAEIKTWPKDVDFISNFLTAIYEVMTGMNDTAHLNQMQKILGQFKSLKPADIDYLNQKRNSRYIVEMQDFYNKVNDILWPAVEELRTSKEKTLVTSGINAISGIVKFAVGRGRGSANVSIKRFIKDIKIYLNAKPRGKHFPESVTTMLLEEQIAKLNKLMAIDAVADIVNKGDAFASFRKQLGEKGVPLEITWGWLHPGTKEIALHNIYNIFTALHEVSHLLDYIRASGDVEKARLLNRLSSKVVSFSERIGLPALEDLESADYFAPDLSKRLTDLEKIFIKELLAVSNFVRPGVIKARMDARAVGLITEATENLVTYGSAKSWTKEEWADYMALLAIWPAKAKELAPTFTKHLQAYIGTNALPEWRKAVESITDFSDTSLFELSRERELSKVAVEHMEKVKDVIKEDIPYEFHKLIDDAVKNWKSFLDIIGVPAWIAKHNKAFAPIFRIINEGYDLENRIIKRLLQMAKFAPTSKEDSEGVFLLKLPKHKGNMLGEAVFVGNWQKVQRVFTHAELMEMFGFDEELCIAYDQVQRYLNEIMDLRIRALKIDAGYDQMTPEKQREWEQNVKNKMHIDGYIQIIRRGEWAMWGTDKTGAFPFYSQGSREEMKRLGEIMTKFGYKIRTYEIPKMNQADLQDLLNYKDRINIGALQGFIYQALKNKELSATAGIRQLLDWIAEQTAEKYQLKRNWTPGYEETFSNMIKTMGDMGLDAARNLAVGGARTKARAVEKMIENPKDRLIAKRYLDSLNNPSPEMWNGLRTATYMWFLSWKASFALVNACQTILTTYPYIANILAKNKVGGVAKTEAIYFKSIALTTKFLANRFHGKFSTGVPDLDYQLRRLWDEEVTSGKLTAAMMGIPTEYKGRMIKAKLSPGQLFWETLGVMQNSTEIWNRNVSAIAGYLAAQELKGKQVFEGKTTGEKKLKEKEWIHNIMKDTVEDTQYIFGNFNFPYLIAGAKGAAGHIQGLAKSAYVFKGFPTNYLLAFWDEMFTKKGTASSRVRMLGALLGLSGLAGLPLQGIITWFLRKFFKRDWERELRERIGPEGQKFADILTRGLPALADVDLSVPLGVGDFLSPTFNPASTFFGPATQMILGLPDALKYWERGDTLRALAKVAPVSIANAFTSLRWQREGIRAPDGRLILRETLPKHIFMKSMGFTPLPLSRKYEEEEALRWLTLWPQELNKEYNEKIAKAESLKDWEKVRKLRQEIREYNAKTSPDQHIRPNRTSIDRRKKEIRTGQQQIPTKLRKKARELKSLYE